MSLYNNTELIMQALHSFWGLKLDILAFCVICKLIYDCMSSMHIFLQVPDGPTQGSMVWLSTYRNICHTLVEAGASLTRLDYQSNAPDDKARQNGDKELARYLRGEILCDRQLDLVLMCVHVFRSRTSTAYLQG